jgi:hypothetical protein
LLFYLLTREETHRCFFHCFIYWGSTVLYHAYVQYPRTAIQCKEYTKETDGAGFHGCFHGSTDATHITMMRCPVSRANEHRGPKELLPARTYNITVNHRRQILNTTKGHPYRWNDKTLSQIDEYIKFIKKGKVLFDNKFTLLERQENGTVVEQKYSGCWLMCDNGYQNWSCLMSPIKNLFCERNCDGLNGWNQCRKMLNVPKVVSIFSKQEFDYIRSYQLIRCGVLVLHYITCFLIMMVSIKIGSKEL